MSWFKDLKLASKLIVAFAIVAVIAIIVGGVGIYNITNLGKNDEKLYSRMTVPLGELLTYVDSYQKVKGTINESLSNKTTLQSADIEEITENENLAKTNLENFATTILTTDGKKLIQSMQSDTETYFGHVDQAVELIKNDKMDEAITYMDKNTGNVTDSIEANYATMKDMKISLADSEFKSNQSILQTAITMMVIFCIAAVIIAMALGVAISKMISNPIAKLLEAAKKLAQRDMDVTIDVQSKDEIGTLAAAFQEMCDNVTVTLRNINEATEQVAAGSTQVSDSSIALSQGVTQQASALEELTASVEEIARQTTQNAEAANKASDNTKTAQTNAVVGNSHMNSMITAMEEINESSRSISKIIKVIDDIAFQTNILALNAAVEAARAGQHGKGFAVVAEEVRNLAARSASAANETTGLIENSMKKVEEGRKIANETAEALTRIVSDIASATELVSNIATASTEQAVGVEQINQGITQIADVVQSTSATAEETASASEELSSQAVLLKEQVNSFRLKRESVNTHHDNYDDLTPEVRRLIESMGKKNHQQLAKKGKGAVNKIPLSDSEFEKY